ncbi:hypothetical protein [Streptomyces griseoloalbus]|uniref:Integral membrane protein n=1 Tax=Streptomyces griseoloalbus TaxID=67303 RepID=A0A7W8F9U3_9ACTN|nr:hypothetical protein [Streptomyces albaduncus]
MPGRERIPADRVALRGDLRSAAPDATAAVLVTAAVFALLYARMESGDSDTVAVMPFMNDPGTYWMYLLSQAFGWSALLWAWGTVMLGLLDPGPVRLRTGEASRGVLNRRRGVRTRLVLLASGVYAAVFALLLWQALRGQPLIHPDGMTLAAALAILAVAVLGTYGCLRAPTRSRAEAADTAVADAPKELVS